MRKYLTASMMLHGVDDTSKYVAGEEGNEAG